MTQMQGAAPSAGAGPIAHPVPAHRNAMMWGGGALAAGALGLIIYVAYRNWYKADLAHGPAYGALTALALIYLAAVFVASYGYKVGDVWEAVRLTAIIVLVTVAFVVIIAAVFIWMAATKDSDSSSSSSSSSKEPSSGDSGSDSGGGTSSLASESSVSDRSTYYGRRDTLAEAALLATTGMGRRDPETMAAARVNAPATCPSCGHALADGDRFCGGCGGAVQS